MQRPDATDLQVALLRIAARRLRAASAAENLPTVSGADLLAMTDVESARGWRSPHGGGND